MSFKDINDAGAVIVFCKEEYNLVQKQDIFVRIKNLPNFPLMMTLYSVVAKQFKKYYE